MSTGVAKRAAGAGGRRRDHWAAVPTRARTAGAPHDRDGTRGGAAASQRRRNVEKVSGNNAVFPALIMSRNPDPFIPQYRSHSVSIAFSIGTEGTAIGAAKRKGSGLRD